MADVLDELGHHDQIFNSSLRLHSTPGGPFIGRARTALVQALSPGERFEPVSPEKRVNAIRHFEKNFQAGDIMVAHLECPVEAGLIGNLYGNFWSRLGVVGVVTNGLVRDIQDLRKVPFGVVAAGTSPANGVGRTRVAGFDRDVVIGGVRVRTGDVIFVDTDGALAIPAEVFDSDAFRERAKMAFTQELETLRLLALGEPLSEIFSRIGRL